MSFALGNPQFITLNFITHPDAMREYSRIKEEAKLYPYDIEGYIEHKSTFIEKIYAEIGI